MNQRTVKSNVQSSFSLAVVTAVTIALLGGTTVSAMQPGKASDTNKSAMSSKQDKPAKESQAATDLRKGLNSLLQDHVTTNLTVNRAIVSGASEATINEAEQAQFANTASLSAAIGSVYGADAATAFSELFNEHIEESNNIARAIAAGDGEAKAEAQQELIEYLEDITNFFVGAIDVLPYEAVYSLLEEHEMLVNKSTEALQTMNFGQSKKFEQQAIRQISVIADALASGIIATQSI